MRYFTRRRLSTRILLQSSFIITAFILLLICFSFIFASRLKEDKGQAIRQLVESAHTLLAEFDARAQRGELTPEDARSQAKACIKTLRYSGKEYFWINDLRHIMIMHPYKPELDGKDVTWNKDPDGIYPFQEFVRTCQQHGEGSVEYSWPKHEGAEAVPKISYVKLFKPWGWIIGTGIYLDDLHQDINRKLALVLILSLIITAGGTVFAILMARSISRPLNDAVEGLSESTDQLEGAAGQIASSSQALAESSSEQAASLEETSASMEEISSMTRQNAENAKLADQLMMETRRIIEQSNTAMGELSGAMNEISRTSQETARIIKSIDEIAFQTNLLALNAAVEAARAGEAGAGFAVVADEVRNLALRAAEAARNTSSLIEDSNQRVERGAQLTGRVRETFQQTTVQAAKVANLVDAIATASQEQSNGIGQISQALTQMDQTVQQNSANAEESASAATQLHTQAENMRMFVGHLVRVADGE